MIDFTRCIRVLSLTVTLNIAVLLQMTNWTMR